MTDNKPMPFPKSLQILLDKKKELTVPLMKALAKHKKMKEEERKKKEQEKKDGDEPTP